MLSHIDKDGNATMVDISEKNNSDRVAIASGLIEINKETLRLVESGDLKKGDVLTVAKIAAIQASKKTSSLIPLCHNINLNKIDIQFKIDTQENLTKCMTYMNRLESSEMQALFFTMLMKNSKTRKIASNNKVISQWCVDNHELF